MKPAMLHAAANAEPRVAGERGRSEVRKIRQRNTKRCRFLYAPVPERFSFSLKKPRALALARPLLSARARCRFSDHFVPESGTRVR